MRLDVLFESDELIAVDKPAGALSVPSRLGHGDPRPCVLHALSQRYGRPFLPVHRLDEDVTGVLVFAKTAEAHRRLNLAFETRTTEKVYEAWTEARMEPPAGEVTFEDLLVRGKKRSFVAPHGKPAITVARVVGRVAFGGREYLRWELRPRTGRSHQLRVQLARRGFPILGDRLYGANEDFVGGGIALRAVRLDAGVTLVAPDLAAWVARGGR